MAVKATDITGERLIETLADMGWHEVKDLKATLVKTVAPGTALRKYETRTRPPSPATPRSRLPNEDQKIQSGAKIIVNERIGALIKSGRLEYNEDRTQIRLVEQRRTREGACPTCQRPFQQPTRVETTSPPSATKPVVVYPDFPAWVDRMREAT